MNALKSLGRLVWGSNDSPELFKFTSGVLYEMRPGARVPRKCAYKDAELVLRRTDAEFQYQLVAIRVLEEGEADLTENDELDLDDERAFLVGTELKFTSTSFEGAQGFKWSDPTDPEGTGYEYIIDSSVFNVASRDAFALAVARCAWERKNRRSYTKARDDEIQRIVTWAEDEELENLLNNVNISDDDIKASLDQAPTQPSVGSPAMVGVQQQEQQQDADTGSSAAAGKGAPLLPTRKPSGELPPAPSELAEGEVIVSVLGELYLFDASAMEFVQTAKEVALTVVETEKYTYWVNVASNERSYVSQVIEPAMNAVFNHDHRSLIWNYFDEDDGSAYSFSVIAADETHYEALHQGMTRAAYETLNQEPWSKAAESSQDYVLDAYEEDVEYPPVPEDWSDEEMEEEEEEEEEEEASNDEDEESGVDEDGDEIDQIFRRAAVPDTVKTVHYHDDESESEEEDDEDDKDDESVGEEKEEEDEDNGSGEDDESSNIKGEKNSMLAVGYKHNRSFVVRGNRIGVFRHTEDDQIKFDTTINRIDDTHGNEFTPSAVMLHEQDSAMVLMNKYKPHELYKMDLEYGKVVEEWKVHEDIPTVSIAPNTKYGQMTADKTLVGLSHNMVYRIDPRISGDNLVVQDQMQSYTTKSHFTSAATTEAGGVVVGSGKGEIRLFDRVGVRAKTVLPALGEPILGVDVTSDGRYVVATCKTYLLLVDTKIPDDPKGSTGFQKSFPKAQKPAPKRLQLKPEHVVYMGAPVAFTPARFNQSPDGNRTEKTIVTSTGPFVITWNLRRALGTGRGDAYHIKQYPDLVVADNFRFGQDRSIVVALPNDVQTVRRSQLAKPTRESLMVRSSPRNDIVSSPY
ncbi:Vacuolar import and degradation protein 27 [Dipsacomyces acuminosporus]|nr:Vacuolar import and degradation protein 27 [Dipsacomyces acuminosporus]